MSGESEGRSLDRLVRMLKKAEGVVETSVSGGSMGGAFAEASAVRIAVRDGSQVRTGDVAAMLRGRRLVAHRVVLEGSGRGKAFVVTQGDAMRVPDAPVRRDALLGVVVALRRNGAWEPLPGGAPPAAHRVLAVVGAFLRIAPVLAVTAAEAVRLASGVRRLLARARRGGGGSARSAP